MSAFACHASQKIDNGQRASGVKTDSALIVDARKKENKNAALSTQDMGPSHGVRIMQARFTYAPIDQLYDAVQVDLAATKPVEPLTVKRFLIYWTPSIASMQKITGRQDAAAVGAERGLLGSQNGGGVAGRATMNVAGGIVDATLGKAIIDHLQRELDAGEYLEGEAVSCVFEGTYRNETISVKTSEQTCPAGKECMAQSMHPIDQTAIDAALRTDEQCIAAIKQKIEALNAALAH